MFMPPIIDEYIATSQVIDALFPSDDLVQATRRVLNQISIADDEKKSMMLFEPWQVRINEKDNELYFSDVSEGYIYTLDLLTKNVKQRILPIGKPSLKRISKLTGSMLFKFGSFGDSKGCLSSPKGVVYDKKQAQFVVSDTGNNRIQIFDRFGHCLKTFKSRDDDSMYMKPLGICISYQLQELIVCEIGTLRIQIFKNWKRRSHEMQQNLIYHFDKFNDISIIVSNGETVEISNN
ncbi:hypothetical protein FDP41_001415 [Naegleria fowleri]|uniref:Uncharacterized protein n=1 Tax=Naegleria fowleri TaxID=5763 RepID=A0A6A5BYF6_NAEFO|nr:uncharacterized protein FDP41_001415 [Naegleria fowleri]KAF0979551.1 hypothetical protein FDP41_001415 [Naegleria fowleri]CAG4716398.1 unnamed protein product [Naegleria fowleri]